MCKKAILVVSFGTSYQETREKTIDRIEEIIEKKYPDYALYRGWTSQIIMNKLKKNGIQVLNVKEAFEQMKRDGIRRVYVQPTHVIPGIENDGMIADARCFSESFQAIHFGKPLLTDARDHMRFIEAFCKEYEHIPEDEAIALMGHGSDHYANAIYAALEFTFHDKGHRNVFVGTVEGYPDLNYIQKQLSENGYKKVHLVPLMIVAGDHVNNDMAGEKGDSWKCVLTSEGYQVTCYRKGLGEYSFVQDMFLEHLERVID